MAATSDLKRLNALASKFGLLFLKILRAYSVPSWAIPTLTLALKPEPRVLPIVNPSIVDGIYRVYFLIFILSVLILLIIKSFAVFLLRHDHPIK